MSSRSRRIAVIFLSAFGFITNTLAAEGRPPVVLDSASAPQGRNISDTRLHFGEAEATPRTAQTQFQTPTIPRAANGEYTVALPLILNAQQTAKPIITSFSANPARIVTDGQTILSWDVRGATDLSISPGIGVVSGSSMTVTPATTTEYTLTAINAVGSATARTTVVVSGSGNEERGALFLNRSDKTNSAAIAVDANGGTHVAYAAFNRDANGKEPAYYAYCAASCINIASWGVAKLSDRVQEVQLALDPGGHPRLLIRMRDQNLDTFYQYAACDTDCANAANWQLETITPTRNLDTSLWEYSQHYFALDPLGRPRFVYYDEYNAPHNGTFYVFCDANCTTRASWREIKVSDMALRDATLTFTTAGQPRLAAVGYPSSADSGALAYILCDTACDNPPNWSGTFLYERGGGHASFVLRLDSNDRPRMAFYQGSLSDGQGQRLYYVWCNTGCADGASWDGSAIGLALSDGQDPSLAIDGQDRPRIAYRNATSDGLRYAWCDTNCESTSTVWQQRLVESSTVLDTEWPIPPPANCTTAFWYGGYRPSLSLDATGNPRIGYDAEHVSGGGNCTQVGMDFKAVRVVVLNQPG
jgi:hypothetical protein